MQQSGDACVVCHKRWPRPRRRVGALPDTRPLFACDECAAVLLPLEEDPRRARGRGRAAPAVRA